MNVKHVDQVETPALLVDIGKMEHNIEAASRIVGPTGKKLRPHIKTHRTSGLALKQLGAHVIGVTCATVGEAEVMVKAGIHDVLLANEVVSEEKVSRLVALGSRAVVTVAVDSPEQVSSLSRHAAQQGVEINILVDIDVGLGRCGVRDVSMAVELSKIISGSPHLHFSGIMGYEGRLRASTEGRTGKVKYAMNLLKETKDAIESIGIAVPVVSGGGTSTLQELLQYSILTEVQAGTYALMEHDLDGLGLPFQCAVSVLGSVISRSPGRVVVDAGRKTIGCDYGLPTTISGQTISVGEEHTIIEWNGEPPPLGERIRLNPSHVRTTFNLHDNVWLILDDSVVSCLPIDARGKSQ